MISGWQFVRDLLYFHACQQKEHGNLKKVSVLGSTDF
jgi:hypothetical protein